MANLLIHLGDVQPGDVTDDGEVVRVVRRQGDDVVLVMTDGTTVIGDAEDWQEVTRDGMERTSPTPPTPLAHL